MVEEHLGQVAHFTYGVVEILRGEELGVGSYGAVYRARCDELVCAAKVLHPILFGGEGGGGGERPIRQFDQECLFLRDLKHPNIVQYLGIHIEGNEQVLLMELMDGNLTNYLERNERDPLPYHLEINISHDVALALAYLHSNFIVHRDLSSNNVLLLGERRAKVSDFGVSRLINPHRQRQSSLTFCPGNSAYMPPEATDEAYRMPYSEKLDCFSHGVLCVQILTRRFPSPTDRLVNTGLANMRAVVSEIERRRDHINMIDNGHPLLETISQCLCDSEEDRPSAQEICHRLVRLKEEQMYSESIQQGNARPAAPVRGHDEDRRRDEYIRELEQLLREARGEREELQHQVRRSRAEITRKNREIEDKTQRIAQFERERLQQRRQIDELTNRVEEIRVRLVRTEQQFQADIMGLQQTICERDQTITELSKLNNELQEELERRDQLMNHQRALSQRASRLRFTCRYGGEAPCQMRREPDATIVQNVVYFKYFWGKHIISYDIEREEWHELPPCPNSSFSMTSIDGYLTIIGGKRPSLDPTNSLLSFVDSEWVECFPSMPTKRYWSIAAKHTTSLIVIGGETEGRTLLCTVEILDTELKEWFMACSLPQPFDSATATVHSEQLFLAGGSSKNTARCVLSCSITRLLESRRPAVPGSGSGHTPREPGVWIRICDLPLWKTTITSLGDHLLAIGGKEENNSASSAIFVHDQMANTWIKIGQLATARSSCFAVSLPRDQLMVVGGLVDNEGKEATSSVEFLTL